MNLIRPSRRAMLGYFCFAKQSDTRVQHVDLAKDYYKVLLLQQGSTQKLVKQAYIKLAKKLHPDVNSVGSTQFIEVKLAYEILSDTFTKTYYDTNNYITNKRKRPQSSTETNSSSRRNYQEEHEAFFANGYRTRKEDRERAYQEYHEEESQYWQQPARWEELAEVRKRLTEGDSIFQALRATYWRGNK